MRIEPMSILKTVFFYVNCKITNLLIHAHVSRLMPMLSSWLKSKVLFSGIIFQLLPRLLYDPTRKNRILVARCQTSGANLAACLFSRSIAQ